MNNYYKKKQLKKQLLKLDNIMKSDRTRASNIIKNLD